MTRPSLPRLWEQVVPREGGYHCWVEEVIVLRITTPYTIKARDARRITAAEMKYLRKKADTLGRIVKQTQRLHRIKMYRQFLDKIQESRRNWLQRINNSS